MESNPDEGVDEGGPAAVPAQDVNRRGLSSRDVSRRDLLAVLGTAAGLGIASFFLPEQDTAGSEKRKDVSSETPIKRGQQAKAEKSSPERKRRRFIARAQQEFKMPKALSKIETAFINLDSLNLDAAKELLPPTVFALLGGTIENIRLTKGDKQFSLSSDFGMVYYTESDDRELKIHFVDKVYDGEFSFTAVRYKQSGHFYPAPGA